MCGSSISAFPAVFSVLGLRTLIRLKEASKEVIDDTKEAGAVVAVQMYALVKDHYQKFFTNRTKLTVDILRLIFEQFSAWPA